MMTDNKSLSNWLTIILVCNSDGQVLQIESGDSHHQQVTTCVSCKGLRYRVMVRSVAVISCTPNRSQATAYGNIAPTTPTIYYPTLQVASW